MNEAYQAALNGAALFERPNICKLKLTGPDAVPFLHNLCTNDIKSLKPGQGCEAYLCDPRAKVLHQFWVDRIIDGLRLETVPGRGEALFKALDRYLISEQVAIEDQTNQLFQQYVAGPKAVSVMESTFRTTISLTEFSHTIVGHYLIRRRDMLGVPGFDMMTADDPVPTIEYLIKHNAIYDEDEDAYETLRIEAGSPEYGKDIDDTRFVMELPNAARAVSFTKGCFPGQEPIVMARDRAGFVNRAFLGMKVLEGGIIPHGTKLTRDGQEIGIVTSSTLSPRLNAPLAIGYVKRGHQERGTKLQAGDQPVELLGYPPLAGI